MQLEVVLHELVRIGKSDVEISSQMQSLVLQNILVWLDVFQIYLRAIAHIVHALQSGSMEIRIE